LQDPTFTKLLEWAKSTLPRSPRWHYRLVLDSEEEKYVEQVVST